MASTLLREWFEREEGAVRRLSDGMFRTPELAEEEREAARLLTAFLEERGFTIETGLAGLPTAFAARYGSGRPVVALLAEYDALPELGQEPVPYRQAIPGPGHGCGHNLLGAGCAGAAAAAREVMERENLPGTLIFFGCPAEETCFGKGAMVKAGCFDEVDVAISWHPSGRTQVSEDSFQALVSRTFRFHGRTAHAASSPEQGRSALDAAELTNVAVNYLREHVPDHVRMHYIYTNAGEKPNIVPDSAGLWYFVRARDAQTVRDADRRVILAAKGAAMATETEVETEELTFSPETKINHTLCRAMMEDMAEAGAPAFTEEERRFAGELRRALGLEGGPDLDETVHPLTGRTQHASGSTDVSAVSHAVPTVTLNTACQPPDAPGHHWGITACAGSALGQRGMLHAACVMGAFALRVLKDPALVEAARREFDGN